MTHKNISLSMILDAKFSKKFVLNYVNILEKCPRGITFLSTVAGCRGWTASKIFLKTLATNQQATL